jgi:hypothetical protein
MNEDDFLAILASRFRHTKRYIQLVKTAPWWSPRSLAATHSQWTRIRGGWRVREWIRSHFCPRIGSDLRDEDRQSLVEAILARDRFLAPWVNPYCVRPRSRSAREHPWYLVAVCHD